MTGATAAESHDGLGSLREYRRAAYSLLAQLQPEFLLSGQHEKVRESGIAAAKAALRRYQAALPPVASPHAVPSPGEQGIRVQIARVNHTLADLTWVRRVGDHAALAEAIRLYDLAIAEPDHMRQLWGSRLDVLDGARATKQDVLDYLAGDYHLVHFACHATFNETSPAESALDLGVNNRITARELLGRRFASSPVVTLSACSSALTSYDTAGNYIGPTGSLLRMGARGIIGSRWSVYDYGTQRFIRALYAEMSGGISAQQAVTRVQRHLSDRRKIEHWAAFSYLGVL